jgi:hypothetical protein
MVKYITSEKLKVFLKIIKKCITYFDYTLEDLKWYKMRFFKVYPFKENVNFDYVVSSNTTD